MNPPFFGPVARILVACCFGWFSRWTVGTNTVAGTGTGLMQTLTVYGRVPVQSNPSPGNI